MTSQMRTVLHAITLPNWVGTIGYLMQVFRYLNAYNVIDVIEDRECSETGLNHRKPCQMKSWRRTQQICLRLQTFGRFATAFTRASRPSETESRTARTARERLNDDRILSLLTE